MGSKEHDDLSVSWNMEANRPGIDSDPGNPFHRSVARLIQTGKPFERLIHTFLRDRREKLRWFGTFVQGKRLVYFPGFVGPIGGVERHRGSILYDHSEMPFDHVTLEPGRVDWHITSIGSQDHLGGHKTIDLGEGRVLWFGVSFESPRAFVPAFNVTSLSFPSPVRDTERRRMVLLKAREGARFPLLDFPSTPYEIKRPAFCHSSIIVGPRGFPTYFGATHGFPIGSPYLAESLPEAIIELPVRIHRMELSPETDLQISLCYLPGSLRVRTTLTSPDGLGGELCNQPGAGTVP